MKAILTGILLLVAAATYCHAFPGATHNLKPQPKDAALPVPTLSPPASALAQDTKSVPKVKESVK